jgi:transcriptional regulator NrdR family protein
MKCPHCKKSNCVVDSRIRGGLRLRKRKCPSGHTAYTKEVYIKKRLYLDASMKPKPTANWLEKIMKKLEEAE